MPLLRPIRLPGGPRRPLVRRLRGLASLAGALALVAALVAPAAADPADVNWSPHFALPGVDGRVLSMVEWNGSLVVAGDFEYAGGVRAANVAISNGTSSFAPLGDGLNDIVTSLAVMNGQLYAAGRFTASGAAPVGQVARWTGSAWTPVGGGGVAGFEDLNLVVDGTSLLLLGEFGQVGTPPVAAECIARWNGSTWESLGYQQVDGNILKYAQRIGGVLYAGRYGLHQFDGTSWTYGVAPAGYELNVVNGLASYGGQLVVAGGLYDPNLDLYSPMLQTFDGSTWADLGGMVPDSDVNGLAVVGTKLFAWGNFNASPGMQNATWDGVSWTPGTVLHGSIESAVAFGGELAIGGAFDYFTRYDGSAFRQVSTGGVVVQGDTGLRTVGTGFGLGGFTYVQGLASYGGRLVATGDFARIGSTSGEFGQALGIAQWDGTQWSGLAGGLNEPFNQPSGENLALWGTKLVVSGYFTGAGGVPSQNIAAWNGTTWESLGGGITGQDARLVSFGGDLVVSTGFTSLGNAVGSGTPLGNVARWNGSTWQSLGAKSGGSSVSNHGLVVWNGRVVFGASFSSIAGVPANNVAAWDGTSWSAMGDGFNGFVTSLGVHAGELYASGVFTASGATPLPGRMARWNGSAWVAVGTGLDGAAVAMHSIGSQLVVAGNFTTAGGQPLPGIAAWNGTTWSGFGSGFAPAPDYFYPQPYALVTHQGGLFVGGSFNRVGDKAAFGIARWQLSGTVDAPAATASRTVALSSPVPNPARGDVRLVLQMPARGHADARVFDASGRLVRRLAQGDRDAGAHVLVWEGRDDRGDAVGPGLYWVRVRTAAGEATARVVRVR